MAPPNEKLAIFPSIGSPFSFDHQGHQQKVLKLCKQPVLLIKSLLYLEKYSVSLILLLIILCPSMQHFAPAILYAQGYMGYCFHGGLWPRFHGEILFESCIQIRSIINTLSIPPVLTQPYFRHLAPPDAYLLLPYLIHQCVKGRSIV